MEHLQELVVVAVVQEHNLEAMVRQAAVAVVAVLDRQEMGTMVLAQQVVLLLLTMVELVAMQLTLAELVQTMAVVEAVLLRKKIMVEQELQDT